MVLQKGERQLQGLPLVVDAAMDASTVEKMKTLMIIFLLVLEGEEQHPRELFHLLDLLLLIYRRHLLAPCLSNRRHLQKLLQMITEMMKDISLIQVMQASAKERLDLIQLSSKCPDDLEKMPVV